jgi:enamidase
MIALTNGILIDGTGRKPTEFSNIVLERNRITRVNSKEAYPQDTAVIDLNSMTVLPGLIDCHLHLGGIVKDEPGQTMGKVSFSSMTSFFWDYLRDYKHRRVLAIENGVTSIRSAGDHFPHIVNLRDKINSGKLKGPRIFTPGPIFTATGGHPAGTIYKGNRYIVEHATRQVDDSSAAREEVKKLVGAGVDCIKAVYGDIDPMNISHRIPKLPMEALRSIVDEAHNNNLRVMVHTGNIEDTFDAVSVGADSIEHGLLPGAGSLEFPQELIDKMIAKETYYVPTMATAWAYREQYPELFEALKVTVKRLFDAGVNIGVGTDAGAPGVVIGKAVHKELELLVDSGIDSLSAITIGTKKSAENLGRGNDLGTVEEGKLADIIVVDGDPLLDMGATKKIKLVIKDGKVLFNRITQT